MSLIARFDGNMNVIGRLLKEYRMKKDLSYEKEKKRQSRRYRNKTGEEPEAEAMLTKNDIIHFYDRYKKNLKKEEQVIARLLQVKDQEDEEAVGVNE